MQIQMENLMIKEKSTGYYSSNSSTTLSELGQHLVNKLQQRVAKAITDKVLETEDIKILIDEYTKKVIDTLPSTIIESINQYIIDQIFLSKDRIQNMLMQQSYQLRNDMYSALHNHG